LTYQLHYHPEAIEEAEAAVSWYAIASERVAERFLDELFRTVDGIVRNPQLFPVFYRDTRKAMLRRFPYSVIYRVASDGIQIIAIAHARRRPNYWRNR